MDYRTEFGKFYKATRDAAGLSVEHMVALVLMSAETNACETEGVNCESDEFWEIAYKSICDTDYFLHQDAVRDWLASRGYEW